MSPIFIFLIFGLITGLVLWLVGKAKAVDAESLKCGRCEYPLHSQAEQICPDCKTERDQNEIRRGKSYKAMRIYGMVLSTFCLLAMLSPCVMWYFFYEPIPDEVVDERLKERKKKATPSAGPDLSTDVPHSHQDNSVPDPLGETKAK